MIVNRKYDVKLFYKGNQRDIGWWFDQAVASGGCERWPRVVSDEVSRLWEQSKEGLFVLQVQELL